MSKYKKKALSFLLIFSLFTAVIKAKAGKKVQKIKITVKPKFYNNYNKLKNYIIDNGIYDYDLDGYEIEGLFNSENQSLSYSFIYYDDIDYITMTLHNYEYNAPVWGHMFVDIDLNSNADPMFFIHFENDDELDMKCKVSMNKITPENNLKWSVYKNESSYYTGRESISTIRKQFSPKTKYRKNTK